MSAISIAPSVGKQPRGAAVRPACRPATGGKVPGRPRLFGQPAGPARGGVAVAGVKYKGSTTADDLYSMLGLEAPAPETPAPAPAALAPTPAPQAPSPPPAVVPAPVEQATSGAVEATKEADSSAMMDAAAGAAAEAGKQVSAGLESVQGAADGLSKAFSSATGSAFSGATDVFGQATDQFSKLRGSLKGGAESLQTTAGGALDSLKGTAGSTVGSFQSAASETAQQLSGAASEAVGSAATAVAVAAGQAVDALPAPVAETLKQAAPAARQASDFLSHQPPGVAAGILAAAIAVPTVVAVNSTVGGFSGVLSAAKAMDVLQNEVALLVDVRSAAEREANGIPELKSAARVKAVAVPIPTVEPSLGSRVEDASDLAINIAAAQIAGLAAVNPRATKVIIMDRNGSRSKAIARLVKSLGVDKSYMLRGGFQAFSKEGLPVQANVSKYEATQLQVVADDVLAASSSLATKLKDPSFAAGAAAGTGLLTFALVNYHITLEFIGVACLQLTIIRKLASYNSPADFFEEVGQLVERVQLLLEPFTATKQVSAMRTSLQAEEKEQ
eukprot:CAMPEP_0117682696 /NCGR_PEP_ID=MMETSP0804-20121206/19851_1 /TAXON_ID=1074897 /ORGANISM="Tetraselmis astigmatica, Strain CCMP880" /LENGTH=557 /DNA_ID=CAMNT_0005492933 /DNA_START=75 /DNA_END=1748 /DNA_ORIENTATION=-